jgi:hypothetical protein
VWQKIPEKLKRLRDSLPAIIVCVVYVFDIVRSVPGVARHHRFCSSSYPEKRQKKMYFKSMKIEKTFKKPEKSCHEYRAIR